MPSISGLINLTFFESGSIRSSTYITHIHQTVFSASFNAFCRLFNNGFFLITTEYVHEISCC